MKTNSWTTAGQTKDILSSPNPLVKVLRRGCHWVWGPNRRRAVRASCFLLVECNAVLKFDVEAVKTTLGLAIKEISKLPGRKCNSVLKFDVEAAKTTLGLAIKGLSKLPGWPFLRQLSESFCSSNWKGKIIIIIIKLFFHETIKAWSANASRSGV